MQFAPFYLLLAAQDIKYITVMKMWPLKEHISAQFFPIRGKIFIIKKYSTELDFSYVICCTLVQ